VPRAGDLTFYSWARGRAELQSTPNFEALVDKGRLVLRHRLSGLQLDVTTDSKGEDLSAKSGFRTSGWQRVDCCDEFQTVLHLYDIRFPSAESEPDKRAIKGLAP